MKILKGNKKIKTILAIILVILVAIIFVGIFSNDTVNASIPVCSNCKTNGYMMFDFERTDEYQHTYKCGICEDSYASEPHEILINNTCVDCNLYICSHSGATHPEGKCTVCGEIYEEHNKSTKVVKFNITKITHTPLYECSFEGCTETYEGTAEDHKGGGHPEGKCTVCKEVYQTHSKSTTIVDYSKTYSKHTPIYACSVEGCTATYEATEEAEWHYGTSHPDVVCTTCGMLYQTHSKSTKVAKYNTTETTHTPVYECSFEGCAKTYTGTEENHTYEMKNDSNQHWEECSTCHAVKGSKTNHTYEIKNDSNQHWEECSTCHTVKGSKANHTGATHPEGKCTVCEEVYQTHSESTNIADYTTTETTHTPLYACSFAGCTETYEGTAEDHTGATHPEGKCTVCQEVYQTHGKSANVVEYTTTETTHTPIYSCSFTGCEETYTGTAENHEGGTNSEGKCTVCEKVYQTHGKSTKVVKYNITDEKHTPVYACLITGCTETYEGTTEDHKGATHPEGKCTVCERVYQTHGKSTTVAKYNTTETAHIPVYKCSFEGCTETYTGTEEKHNFTNDGLCDKCNARGPEEECLHTFKIESNKTYHWEVCSKCKEIKEGTKEKHNYNTYVDKKDGTHTATCSKCKYELVENHIYEDGKCTSCEAIQDNSGSNNNDEGNGAGTTNGDDGKGNEGNSKPSKDTTTSGNEIPKTGLETIILTVIICFSSVAGIAVFKMKKYKGI